MATTIELGVNDVIKLALKANPLSVKAIFIEGPQGFRINVVEDWKTSWLRPTNKILWRSDEGISPEFVGEFICQAIFEGWRIVWDRGE